VTLAPEATWLFDEADFYLTDPYDVYASLRSDDPVHWYERGQFHVVTRHEDIRFISAHPELFSSVDVAIIMDLCAIRDGRTETPPNRGILFTDPPIHRDYRAVLAHELTPRSVKAQGGHVGDVVDRALDQLPGGTFDFIASVAEPIPVWVFSKLLGIPEDSWQDFVRWSTAIAAVGGGETDPEVLELIYEHAGPYVFGLAAERAQCPADDYLTAITKATIRGQPLDEAGVTAFGLSMFGAGSETTQSLIAGMAWALVQHPEQSAAFFDDPSLVTPLIEETLRWWTPVRSMARSAVADVELSGTTIAAGERVLLLYSAANRDPEVFDGDPETFDMQRPDSNKHLGFGFGEHFCQGAHLARREARATFEALADRYSGIELVGEPVRRRSPLMNTFDELPVRLTPR